MGFTLCFAASQFSIAFRANWILWYVGKIVGPETGPCDKHRKRFRRKTWLTRRKTLVRKEKNHLWLLCDVLPFPPRNHIAIQHCNKSKSPIMTTKPSSEAQNLKNKTNKITDFIFTLSPARGLTVTLEWEGESKEKRFVLLSWWVNDISILRVWIDKPKPAKKLVISFVISSNVCFALWSRFRKASELTTVLAEKKDRTKRARKTRNNDHQSRHNATEFEMTSLFPF